MATLTIRRGTDVFRLSFEPPQPLSRLLAEAGFPFRQPCGGRGVCGKCAVQVTGAVSEPTEAERRAGARLACQCVMLGDGEAALAGDGLAQIQTSCVLTPRRGEPMPGRIGAAVDVGTTTVVLRRYLLETGELLGESSMENPQVSVAADVIGRIGAAMRGEGESLRHKIETALSALLVRAGGPADSMVIAGNTTMLYLLTGRDTACLSRLPFEADTLFDCETAVLGAAAYLPPCMNAFVGADITCAVLASGMCAGGTALLCDIGTNGEIALWKDGTLYVSSTAAGPAFEGAGISCGVSGVRGAIDRVWLKDGEIQFHTIGGAPAAGLCGSGLIDAVACLLARGDIDETGAMDPPEYAFAGGVSLTRKDVRAVQLAKAAIAAGIRTLLQASRTGAAEIGRFYIAGGFGSHLNIESAAAISLIPSALKEKAVIIGNAALAGAAQLLLDRRMVGEAQRIAAGSKHVNLGGDPVFSENYMEEMLFGGADA